MNESTPVSSAIIPTLMDGGVMTDTLMSFARRRRCSVRQVETGGGGNPPVSSHASDIQLEERSD
jgi:hypothetical protein